MAYAKSVPIIKLFWHTYLPITRTSLVPKFPWDSHCRLSALRWLFTLLGSCVHRARGSLRPTVASGVTISVFVIRYEIEPRLSQRASSPPIVTSIEAEWRNEHRVRLPQRASNPSSVTSVESEHRNECRVRIS